MTCFNTISRLSCAALLGLAMAACGDAEPGDGRKAQSPRVVVQRVAMQQFSDTVQAVGTAYANESTTLTSTVTERVVSLGFRDGEWVRAGSVIAQLATHEESADLAAAEARAREADQQLRRLQQLQQRGFATNATIDAQMAARNASEAEARAVRARISDRTIRAPFSGVVGLRRISPGSVIAAGTAIATISDLRRIKLDFQIPETLLSNIREGQPITAMAAAWPDTPFNGTVESIEAVVDPISRSITARAVLPNPDQRLRPGMLMTVTLQSSPRTAMGIPEIALTEMRDQSYVYKLDKDNTATRTMVQTGARRDGQVEIREGLAPGDVIVSEGTIKVRDGGKVQPVWVKDAANSAQRDR